MLVRISVKVLKYHSRKVEEIKMRLDKFLAHNGYGTRKDVRKLIKDKHVYVNGDIITDHGFKVNLDQDEVRVGFDTINYTENVYYMLNKPQDTISSTESELYPSVLELLETQRTDLIIVGRLDVDTEGLLLITNDGQFAHQISHGKKNIYKTYYVELQKPFNKKYLEILTQGLELSDGPVKGAKVELIDEMRLLLSISEGKYHQVKRMMHACDNEVAYLKRIQIGSLMLDESLDLGASRLLTDEEIALLLKGDEVFE